MYQYQQRVLALEKQFHNARRNIKRLLKQARFKPDSVAQAAVKTQLDLINALIRLIKEETAFFVKLGQLYDFSLLCDEFVELIHRRDPELAIELLNDINELWNRKAIRKKDKSD